LVVIVSGGVWLIERPSGCEQPSPADRLDPRWRLADIEATDSRRRREKRGPTKSWPSADQTLAAVAGRQEGRTVSTTCRRTPFERSQIAAWSELSTAGPALAEARSLIDMPAAGSP